MLWMNVSGADIHYQELLLGNMNCPGTEDCVPNHGNPVEDNCPGGLYMSGFAYKMSMKGNNFVSLTQVSANFYLTQDPNSGINNPDCSINTNSPFDSNGAFNSDDSIDTYGS